MQRNYMVDRNGTGAALTALTELFWQGISVHNNTRIRTALDDTTQRVEYVCYVF